MKKTSILLLGISFFLALASCSKDEYLSSAPTYLYITIEHANTAKRGQAFCVGDTIVATAIESSRGKWLDRVEIAWKAEKGKCLTPAWGNYIYGKNGAPYNLSDTIVLEQAGVGVVTMTGLYRSMADMRQYNEEVVSADNKFKATYGTQNRKLFYYDVVLEKRFNIAY